MRVSLPSFGVANNSESKWAEVVRYLILLIILIIIVAGVWLVYKHYHDDKKPVITGLSDTQKIQNSENAQMLANNQTLKAGDIAGYMASQNLLASNYMDANDYGDATRVMQNIQTKVPVDKWDIATYLNLNKVTKHNGDTVNYKKYTQKLIDMFKSMNDTTDANHYTQQLQGN